MKRDDKRQIAPISIDEYGLCRAQRREEPKWQAMLAEVHELISKEPGNRELPPVDEIIRQMREEREAHIQDLLR